MGLLLAIAAMVQGNAMAPAFPENVEISQRYDCTVRSGGHAKGRFPPYPLGDYVFLFPADTGLILGKSIPYVHTLADDRTYFERATIEAADPDLGSSFGFALRTRTGAMLAFTKRGVEAEGKARLRGSYHMAAGGAVELEGECKVWNGPIPVTISSP